jgi:hypothetical protein
MLDVSLLLYGVTAISPDERQYVVQSKSPDKGKPDNRPKAVRQYPEEYLVALVSLWVARRDEAELVFRFDRAAQLCVAAIADVTFKRS